MNFKLLVREALGVFFHIKNDDLENIEVTKTDAGMNNWVFYAVIPAATCSAAVGQFVVRLYNNGSNLIQIRYEHYILKELLLHESNLGFQTPRSVTRSNSLPEEDNLFCKLASGMIASVFHWIPGCSPAGNLKFIEGMGAAAGKLSISLRQIYDVSSYSIIQSSPPFYHDIWRVHHMITKKRFYSFIDSCVELEPCRQWLDQLLLDLTSMEDFVRSIQTSHDLPMSFVHGDLATDNFLVDPLSGKVTGIIDFEFVGVDWRVMELATCTSNFPEQSDPFVYFSAFFKGFRMASNSAYTFNKSEVLLFPQFIMLRILSNVVYFVGRAISNELPLTCLTKRLPGYYRRRMWLHENARALIELANVSDEYFVV